MTKASAFIAWGSGLIAGLGVVLGIVFYIFVATGYWTAQPPARGQFPPGFQGPGGGPGGGGPGGGGGPPGGPPG